MLNDILEFFEEEGKLTWFIVFVGFVLIFYISSLEFSEGTGGFSLIPMSYHILSFFFLGLFFFIASLKGKIMDKKSKIILALGFLILFSYAGLDELHQYFVPGRGCCIKDVFLDFIGIFSSFIFYAISLIFRNKN